MKYLSKLTIGDFNVLLNKMGYTLKNKGVDFEQNVTTLKGIQSKDCMIINCLRIPSTDETLALEYLSRKIGVFPVLGISGSYSMFDSFIRFDDYSASAINLTNYEDENENLSKILQKFLYNKFGENYYNDLVEACKKEEQSLENTDALEM